MAKGWQRLQSFLLWAFYQRRQCLCLRTGYREAAADHVCSLRHFPAMQSHAGSFTSPSTRFPAGTHITDQDDRTSFMGQVYRYSVLGGNHRAGQQDYINPGLVPCSPAHAPGVLSPVIRSSPDGPAGNSEAAGDPEWGVVVSACIFFSLKLCTRHNDQP